MKDKDYWQQQDSRPLSQKIREDYGEEAYEKWLEEEEKKDYDGNEDPLKSGYSGPE
jgi:hypothetical protein